MKINACLTSRSDLWRTPKYIYEKYVEKGGFFDPCPVNPTFDGLDCRCSWGVFAFCNPPYSQISKWIDKAIEEALKGVHIVLLIPARTDTKWFKKLYDFGCSFSFIHGRLKFNDSNSAPFPSMLVWLDDFTHINGSSFELIRREDI